MTARKRTTRAISIFLLAFVCLNAGGALCVAYCLAAEPEARADSSFHHCGSADRYAREGRPAFVDERGAAPCPMTASLPGGPIERSSTLATKSIPPRAPHARRPALARTLYRRTAPPAAYPGPPLLDRRPDRITRHVLLI